MKRFRSEEHFNPLEHAVPLSRDEMEDFGIADYSRPKVSKWAEGVPIVETKFDMADGWSYKTASTILRPDQIVTPIAMNATTGWFTDYNDGFNLRRQLAFAKMGMEGTSVSVPISSNSITGRWRGDLEANAYNQARIHRGMAQMLGRHGLKNEAGIDIGRRTDMAVIDGLSRAAMTGQAETGVAPEVGLDVLFAYYTVACRINGVEEVDDIADVIRAVAPINLARAAMRGEIPEELAYAHIIHTIKRAGSAIDEAFGNELTPIAELFTTPIKRLREGESLRNAIGDTIAKFHPDSIVVPYKIISRYPNTVDFKHLDRQLAEAHTLTDGTYGRVTEKASPRQFQAHTGFKEDGLSHHEEIVEWHNHETHPHTIIKSVDGGSHLSSVIEDEHVAWRNNWGTVIKKIGEIGADALAELAPDERWELLHTVAAEENEFFADATHPHHPAPDSPNKPRHLHAA